MPPKPTRLSDVAEAVGYSIATVSRALQDSPQIGEKTRALIKKAALDMGYTPDPHAVGLAHHRDNSHTAMHRETIGLIVYDRALQVRGAFHGAVTEQARALGYGVDLFDLQEFAGKERRLLDILMSRGIRGLILDPYPLTASSLSWPWEHFSVVTIFQQEGDQQFHSANVAHIASAQMLLQELWCRGYSRPGFVYRRSHFTHSGSSQWKLAFEAIRRLLTKKGEFVPDHHLAESGEPDRFAHLHEWVEKADPDVVLFLGDGWLAQMLQRAGYAIPKNVGFCALDLIPGQLESGLVQDRIALVGRALDLLAALLHRNERGLHPEATKIELPPRWNPGNTLRAAQPFDPEAWKGLLLS